MGFFKINRGDPVFSMPGSSRVRVTGIRQEGSLVPRGPGEYPNAGVVFVTYSFAVKISFSRALQLGATSVTFSVKKKSGNNVYKTGMGEIIYSKNNADARVRLMHILGMGNVHSQAPYYGVDVSLSDLMKNKDFENNLAEGLAGANTFLSVSEQSAIDLIGAELASRDTATTERSSLTPGLAALNASKIPQSPSGEINWNEISPEDLAQMSDEALGRLASCIAGSINESGSTGLEIGRTIYRIDDQVSVYSAEMYHFTDGIDMSAIQGTLLGDTVRRLETDPNIINISTVSTTPIEAEWILYNAAGIELDRFSYEVQPRGLLDSFYSSDLTAPTATISYDALPGPSDQVRSVSLNVQNNCPVAMNYLVTIASDGTFDDIDLGSIPINGISILPNNTILIDINAAYASSWPSDVHAQAPGLIAPDSSQDITAPLNHILQIIGQITDTPGGSLIGLKNLISRILSPPAGSTISYSIYFPSPLAGANNARALDTSISSKNFTITFTGEGDEEEEQRNDNLIQALPSTLAAWGGNITASAGLIRPAIIIPGVDKPFMFNVQQGNNGAVRINVRTIPQSAIIARSFTRARITRDVVGDSGMQSYCSGNRVILRPFSNREYWSIEEFVGGAVQIDDVIMPNTRYRYDIELADSCYEYSTYLSILHSNINSSVLNLRPPLVEISNQSSTQSAGSSLTSFDITGTFGLGPDSGGFQLLVDALRNAGQSSLYQANINEQRDQLNSLIAYEIIRTNLSNGEVHSFGIYRGPSSTFVDSLASCRARRLPPLNSLSDYVYEISIFIAKGEDAFPQSSRMTRELETGLKVEHRGIMRDATGNELPNPQQFGLAGQDKYVPGPTGFWPVGRRHYININGTAPAVPTGRLLGPIRAQDISTTGYYNLCVEILRDPASIAKYCKIDVYCLYTITGKGTKTNAVFCESWPIAGSPCRREYSIDKNKLWDRIPISASSLRFKVVAVSELGQVIDIGETQDSMSVPLETLFTLSEPVILDSFMGQRVFPIINPHSETPLLGPEGIIQYARNRGER